MTVFQLKTKIFVSTLVVLFLTGTLFSYLSRAITTMYQTETGLSITFEAISYLSGALLVLLLFTRFWTLMVRAGRALWSLFETEELSLAKESQIEEVKPAQETMQSLAQALAEMEKEGNEASLLLYDAHQYAARLVALIKAIVMKAQSMRTEAEILQVAMEAIASHDPVQIAGAAGKVRDTHIRDLMLCDVQTQHYWASVTRLIATQLGTLEQWSQGYDTFASNLLTEVSGAKARLQAMSASLELIGTARPLLQIQQNLNQAETYLLPENKPLVGYALKALPPINTARHNLTQTLVIDEVAFAELD
jgi:hypothetical protein